MSDLDQLKEFMNSSPPAEQQATSPGLDQLHNFMAPELKEQQFGSPGQQAIAGVEGALRGATLGGSDILENKLGISTPENIKARMETNPATSFVSTGLGGAALAGVTGGLAAPAEAVLGPGLAASTLGMGAEGALFGAGSAVSDYALGDSNLNAQKVLSDIGFGAATGIGLGALGYGLKSAFGKFGNAKGSMSEAVADEANQANRESQTQQVLEPGLKKEAPEIIEAANRQGLPVMTGMVSDNTWIQKAEDSLINGAPTYSGIKRAGLYQQGYDKAVDIINKILPSKELSSNDLGQGLQESLTAKIDQEAAPFEDLYNDIKQDTKDIPLKNRSAPAIARNIQELIADPAVGKNSPAAKLALDIADEIPDLESVGDIRAKMSSLSQRVSPTASPAEKRIIGIVRDKLDNWWRSTTKDYAQDFISKFEPVVAEAPEGMEATAQKIERLKTLITRVDEANSQYAPFRQKISELGSWLGKGRIQGAQHAIQFIQDELEPEQLVKKLTDRKYAGLFNFMEKNFPEEAALVREYQKKQLYDAASKTGTFSPKIFFNRFNDLEPEIQKAIFHPDEIERLKDVDKYLKAIPKNFNPSGTAGMSAFREFFHSIPGAAISNARDFGIEAFIKTMGALPEDVRPSPYEVGQELSDKLNKFTAIQRIRDRVNDKIETGINAVLTGASAGITEHNNLSYDEKVERISQLSRNPDALSAQLSNHVNGLDQHLPNVAQGATSALATQVAFLNSKVPQPKNSLMKLRRWEPSPVQKQQFNRYYNAVDKPLNVFKSIKTGALTSEEVEAMSVCHPDLLKDLRSKLNAKLSPDLFQKLDYKTKQSLSMFMGEPLDESMLQKVGQANQMILNQAQGQKVAQQNTKPTAARADKVKVANRAATQTQMLEDAPT